MNIGYVSDILEKLVTVKSSLFTYLSHTDEDVLNFSDEEDCDLFGLNNGLFEASDIPLVSQAVFNKPEAHGSDNVKFYIIFIIVKALFGPFLLASRRGFFYSIENLNQ